MIFRGTGPFFKRGKRLVFVFRLKYKISKATMFPGTVARKSIGLKAHLKKKMGIVSLFLKRFKFFFYPLPNLLHNYNVFPSLPLCPHLVCKYFIGLGVGTDWTFSSLTISSLAKALLRITLDASFYAYLIVTKTSMKKVRAQNKARIPAAMVWSLYCWIFFLSRVPPFCLRQSSRETAAAATNKHPPTKANRICCERQLKKLHASYYPQTWRKVCGG